MNRIDGPAREMVFPEPMNNPVPIAPPIAINCKCRFDNLRCNSFGDDFASSRPVVFIVKHPFNRLLQAR